MERVLETEWLDELPAQDARARRSRDDLRRVNRWMGHCGLIARALSRHGMPQRVCDLGGGDGTLLLRVARYLRWRGVEVVLIDRQPVVSEKTREGFAKLGCNLIVTQGLAVEALDELPPCDAIIANLFLHHFSSEELRDLFERIKAHTAFFFACEPSRGALSLLASRCLGLIGCNSVTRHDAIISVRAGFRDLELTEIWGNSENWSLREHAAGLFSHCFSAQNDWSADRRVRALNERHSDADSAVRAPKSAG